MRFNDWDNMPREYYEHKEACARVPRVDTCESRLREPIVIGWAHKKYAYDAARFKGCSVWRAFHWLVNRRKRRLNYRFRVGRKTCEACNSASSVDTHHIIPLGEGGEDVESNLMAVCLACHREKHPELPDSFFLKGTRDRFRVKR